MTIIFSTLTRAHPTTRFYFEAPADALLVRVAEKVTEWIGNHQNYCFHDKAPDGVTPIILEGVGPSALPVEATVVNLIPLGAH